MAVIKKTLFPKNLDKFAVLVNDTQSDSKYFKITELPDTFTGGKNAFLIAGSEHLVPDTKIQIEIKSADGNVIYHEPGEGLISSSINGESFVTEYYEGVSKVVAVYIYPDTSYGPCTLTILGELSEYEDGNGIMTPVPLDWEGKYNVKWQKEIDVNPSLPNTTKIRFYRRPTPTINELVEPIYRIETGSKVPTGVNQSFADIKLSNLETFAGDVKRVKVFRTSEGTISDYDLIQDILVESKELLTSFGLSGSVVGNTGIFTTETLQNYWNTGSLTTQLTSSRVESGLKLNGSGLLTYTTSLDLKSTNTYELNLDAFYSSSTKSNLGLWVSYVSQSTTFSSSIGTLYGLNPTTNLLDSVFPFKIDRDYPTASLYLSQSQGEWHVGNISLKLSQDTAFSPDEISFITTMPTVVGNETFNFKFEFYDVNNNYVPVAVTQSALFTGGTTGSAIDVNQIISSSISASLSQSLDALYQVSSSISGTVTFNSSSISGSLGFVSSSVSGTIGNISGSISQSVALNLSSSLSKVKLLADGGYPGTFIESSSIYSPNIAGQSGYFSGKFQVGATNPIILDATTSTRKIYIGAGTGSNANTSVYLDSAGQFSLADKLTWNGSALTVNGTINVTGGNAATDTNAQLYATRAATSASVSASAAYNNAKAIADAIANGTYSGGTLISNTSIISPIVAGADGYFSNTFRVGNNGITLDGTNKKIYVGTGTYANANTPFYFASGSTNIFSLGSGFTWDGTNLTVGGNASFAGNLSGASGTFSGTVTANGGTIGGWTIDSSKIYVPSAITLDSTAKSITLFDSSNVARVFLKQSDAFASLSSGVAQTAYAYDDNRTSGPYSAGTYENTIAGPLLTSGKTFNLKAVFTTANGTRALTITSGTPIAIDVYARCYIKKTTSPYTEYLIAEYKDGVSFGSSVDYAAINNKAGTITFSGDGATYDVIQRVTWTYQGYSSFTASQLRLPAFTFTASPANSFVEIIAGGIQFGRDVSNYVIMDRAGAGAMLQVGGEGTFTGDVTANTSDRRLKKNIINIDNPLEKLSKINGVYFNWNETANVLIDKDMEEREVGFIAQEIEEVLPEIVKPAPFDRLEGRKESKTGENYLTIQYEKIVPLLVESIKELKKEIEDIKNNR